jgi:hypothetical protein
MNKETLEEAAERYIAEDNNNRYYNDFIAGAKWQQERMYSEEELKQAFNKGMTFERGEYQSENTYSEFTGFQKPNKELSFEEWFAKFKKK